MNASRPPFAALGRSVLGASLIATALAQNEWVSHRCRDFTRRQSLSDVAFARRCCMTLTFFCTLRQLMALHSAGICEDAEPRFSSITLIAVPRWLTLIEDAAHPEGVNCVPSRRYCLYSRLTTIAPDGSLPAFTVGQIWNPYPRYYCAAFAFSILPYLLSRRLPLRVACRMTCSCQVAAGNQAYHVP